MQFKRLDFRAALCSLLLMAGMPAMAGTGATNQYVIERDIPGAHQLSADELTAISRKSRDVLESLGPDIRWLHSYVAQDKVYCVYQAPGKDLIEQHAQLGGFPANRVSQVSTVIDPSTAERPLASEQE